MQTFDLINGGFELCGAYFTWRNFAAYRRDRELAGVYWPTTAFFTVWGLWNLVYYPALGQELSFLGGLALVAGNLAWLAYVLWDKLMRKADAAIDAWLKEDGMHASPVRHASYCSSCETWGYDHRSLCDDDGSLSR